MLHSQEEHSSMGVQAEDMHFVTGSVLLETKVPN